MGQKNICQGHLGGAHRRKTRRIILARESMCKGEGQDAAASRLLWPQPWDGSRGTAAAVGLQPCMSRGGLGPTWNCFIPQGSVLSTEQRPKEESRSLLDSVNPFPLSPYSLLSFLPLSPLPLYILLVLGLKPRTLPVLGEALSLNYISALCIRFLSSFILLLWLTFASQLTDLLTTHHGHLLLLMRVFTVGKCHSIASW